MDFIDISNQIDTEDILQIGPSNFICVPSAKLSVRQGARQPLDGEDGAGLSPDPEAVLTGAP